MERIAAGSRGDTVPSPIQGFISLVRNADTCERLSPRSSANGFRNLVERRMRLHSILSLDPETQFAYQGNHLGLCWKRIWSCRHRFRIANHQLPVQFVTAIIKPAQSAVCVKICRLDNEITIAETFSASFWMDPFFRVIIRPRSFTTRF